MQIFNFISINIFAFIMLVYVLIHTLRHDRPAHVRHWLFVFMVIFVMCILVVDAGAWAFNLLPGRMARTLNILFNILLFSFGPVPAVLWYMYADYLAFHSLRRLRVVGWVFAPIVLINVVMSVLSPYYNLYFTVDASNVYHRGLNVFYYFFVLITFGLFLFVLAKIIVQRKRFERRYLPALLLFAVPPFIGNMIQLQFYGTNVIWSTVALSLLHVFISVQNHRLNTDYLTGANNRRQLNAFLKDRIRLEGYEIPFGAMMLDLDDFKHINDTYGHAEGDRALEDTVKVLRQSLREQDPVYRYGGDEFLIILDVHSRHDLDSAVARIHTAFERFNQSANKPYVLTASIGSLVYEKASGMKPDEFIDQLDKKMYQEKNRVREK